MNDIVSFVSNHWAEIGVVVLAAFKLIDAIVALTPNKTDDAIAEKVEAVVGKVLPKLLAK